MIKKRAKPWPVDNGIYAAILTIVRVYPEGLTSGEISKMLAIKRLRVMLYIKKLKLLGMVKIHRRSHQNILYLDDLYVDEGEEYTFNALIEKLRQAR